MATLLSGSAFSCQFSHPLPLPRLSAVTSTAYGVQTLIGLRGRWNSKCRVRVQAQKHEEEGRERREEPQRDKVYDLESALGIEKRTVRNVSSDKKDPERRQLTILDALQEQMRVNEENQPPENKFMQTLRQTGDYLIDKTENTGGQDNVVRFAFLVFPIWFVALLVTSGVVTLPFDLPFLRNLSQHLAETQSQ